MAASFNTLFPSSRRSHTLGLLVAGGILFVIGFGGSGLLFGMHTGFLNHVVATSIRVAA
jgi:hypothetical protein